MKVYLHSVVQLAKHGITNYWRTSALILIIIASALMIRVPDIRVGLPYFSYVDEGHVMHSVGNILKHQTVDPGWYGYPPATMLVIAGMQTIADVLSNSTPDAHDVLSQEKQDYYDIFLSTRTLLTARFFILICSIVLLLLYPLIGKAIAATNTGIAMMVIAAFLPPIVTRSTIVLVDTPAVLFAMTAITATFYYRKKQSVAIAFFVGIMIATAAFTKYTYGILAPAVGIYILLNAQLHRIRYILAYILGGGITSLVFLWCINWNVHGVLDALKFQSEFYKTISNSVWNEAWFHSTWYYPYGELPIIYGLLVCAGIVYMLCCRRYRMLIITLLSYVFLFILPLTLYPYKPFRNYLFPVALSPIPVTILLADVFQKLKLSQRIFITTVALLTISLFFPFIVGYLSKRQLVRDSRISAQQFILDNPVHTCPVYLEEEIAWHPETLKSITAAGHPLHIVKRQELHSVLLNTPTNDIIICYSGHVPVVSLSPTAGPFVKTKFKTGSRPLPKYSNYWRTMTLELTVISISPHR